MSLNTASLGEKVQFVDYVIAKASETDSVAQASHEFKLFVDGSNNYFVEIAGNYFPIDFGTNVSSSGAIGSYFSNIILSSGEKHFSDLNKIIDFYNTNVKTDNSGMTLVTTKKLTHFSSGLDLSTFVNGSVNLVDLVIAKSSGTDKVEKGLYTFSVYTDGTYYYVKINNVYAFIGARAAGEVHTSLRANEVGYFNLSQKNINLRASDSTSYFADSGLSYTAFSTAAFMQPDSVIYNLTGQIKNNTSYTKYTNDSKNYIAVQVGNTIEIVDITTIETIQISTNGLADYANQDDAEKLLNFMVNEYYSSYYNEIAPAGLIADDKTVNVNNILTDFKILQPATWSPIGAILYRLGISSNAVIKHFTSQNGSKRYIKVTENIDGIIVSAFIEYTNLVTYSDTGSSVSFSDTKTDVRNIFSLRASLVRNVCDTTKFPVDADPGDPVAEYRDYVDLSISNYLTSKSIIQTIIDGLKDISECKTEFSAAGIEEGNPTSWKWIDIFYYYVYGKLRSAENEDEQKFFVYYTSSGLYTAIEYMGSNFLFGQADKTFFKNSGSVDYIYSADSVNPLALIANKLTNQISGSLRWYSFLDFTGTERKFYYVRSTNDENYYAFFDNIGTEVSDLKVLDKTGNYVNYEVGQIANYQKLVYAGKNPADLHEWSFLDFVFSVGNGYSRDRYFMSYIYKYGNERFLLIGDYYLNLNLFADSTLKTKIYGSDADEFDNGFGYFTIEEVTLNEEYNIKGVGLIGVQVLSTKSLRQQIPNRWQRKCLVQALSL